MLTEKQVKQLLENTQKSLLDFYNTNPQKIAPDYLIIRISTICEILEISK